MAVEKPIGFEQQQEKAIEQLVEIQGNDFADGLAPKVEMQQDGGAIVGDLDQSIQTGFDMNIAEVLDDDTLNEISSDLRQAHEDDKSSRKDWEDSYKKGLDLLGFKYEETSHPFQGASAVTHPMLAEAITQFQAQAYRELLPASGPVSTQIVGKVDRAKEEQAQRVKEFMNYQIMHVMEEYDPDMDSLLFYLPLSGSAFKKIYYDAGLGRAVSKFVPSDDLYVPYHTTDLETAERITHVIRRTENDIRKLQVSGFYRDVDLKTYEDETALQEKENKLAGMTKVQRGEEFQLLEMHVELNIKGIDADDGIKVPYIVTIDEGSNQVLSIYRNYKQDDPRMKKTQYFVHYKFLPGFGFYGFGLIHMLGGLSRTATSALRQLLDAGTLSNLPAGFKARGLRIRDDDAPLQPGEFRDVDAPGGSLREGLVPLPYKEPSGTLFQLLGFCIEAGSRFAAIADQKIGDAAQAGAPVGTTMALLERGSRIMSAIHKRLHYAQRIEFKLLAKIFADDLPQAYPYALSGEGMQMMKAEDFSPEIDIIPISDPNIFSISQRVTLAQTQLQLAQADPASHNMYEAYRRMYQALGVKDIDVLLPVPSGPQPTDPGMENAGALGGGSLTAFRGQNHGAHIAAHRAFFASVLVRNNPQVMLILQAHIMEHVSIESREEAEDDVAKQMEEVTQQYGGEIPPELQAEMQEALEQQIAERIAAKVTEMAQEEAEFVAQQGQDPLVMLKEKELGLREAEINRKAMNDQADQEMDAMKLAQDAKIAQDRIDSQEDIAQLRANVNLSKQKNDNNRRRT